MSKIYIITNDKTAMLAKSLGIAFESAASEFPVLMAGDYISWPGKPGFLLRVTARVYNAGDANRQDAWHLYAEQVFDGPYGSLYPD